MIVYKVVNCEGEQFVSAVTRGKNALKYAIGQTTRPNFGFIYTFRTLNSAMDFPGLYGATILRCRASPVSRRLEPVCSESTSAHDRQWWKDYFAGKAQMGVCPDGTVWCHSVTPLEIVQ